jgi:hypothetical protein
MAASLSALRAGRPLPPGRFLVLISVRGCIDPGVRVRLEGLGQLTPHNKTSIISVHYVRIPSVFSRNGSPGVSLDLGQAYLGTCMGPVQYMTFLFRCFLYRLRVIEQF